MIKWNLFLLTQEPNIDFLGWVSLLGSSVPSIFWVYLLKSSQMFSISRWMGKKNGKVAY